MCLTAVDQSAPEALEESQRVEELARRLGDREMLLRNYMVLVPWWQASAEYATINRILVEARTEAEALGDAWTLQLITTYEATTRIWQGMLSEGLAQIRMSYEASGLPLGASLSDLPPMRSVELMALAAPRAAAALGCWLCGHATEALADRRRCAPLHDRAAGPASPGRRGGDLGHHGAARRRAGGRHQVGRRGVTRRRRGQHDDSGGNGPGHSSGGRARASKSRSCRARSCAPTSRCCWPTTRGWRPTGRSPLLGEALETSRTTGERFCEAEILRVRAGRLHHAGRTDSAVDDLREAVELARVQGAKMLELRALTDWARLEGSPDSVRAESAVVHRGRRRRRAEPESRRSEKVWSDVTRDRLERRLPGQPAHAGRPRCRRRRRRAVRRNGGRVVGLPGAGGPAQRGDRSGAGRLPRRPRTTRPPWVDPELVAAGQERFARWGSHVFTAPVRGGPSVGVRLLARRPGPRA